MTASVIATVLAIATVVMAPAARAQQRPATPPLVGYLSGSDGAGPREEAFRQGLRELGYVEGKTIVIEWRFGEGKPDRLADLAADLVRRKVDVIVTDGTRMTRTAKDATKTIPIVMASDADPLTSGHVASLARPGGNITGLTNINPGLAAKRLEILKEAIPGISRVAVLWSPDVLTSLPAFKETEIAGRALGLRLQSLEVRRPDDFEGAFRAATKGEAGAVTVLSDALMFAHRARIVALAAKQRIPTVHTQSLWVEAGGLMSYGTHFPDLYRRAAGYVDRILKGAKPAELPVEQPTKFELVINLKTAKTLGLTLAQSLLIRADQVIQ